MKTLVIKSERDSFERTVNEWLKNENIDLLCLDEKKTGIKKRKYYCSQFKEYSKKRYDKVIIFDNTTAFLYAHFYFHQPFLWFWNTISDKKIEHLRIKLCSFMKYKMYSFDEGDCKKYKLSYNTQFFQKSIDAVKTNRDAYFVGTDKGRYELIKKVYNHLIEHDIKPLFQIIPDNEKEYELAEIIHKGFVEYDTVLQNVSSSKVILDITKIGQTGMTMRAMEALFYDKKIITNNPLYTNLPFYRKDAVFILNDNLDGLVEFINAADITYDDSIKDYYSVENWLRRFE